MDRFEAFAIFFAIITLSAVLAAIGVMVDATYFQ